MIALKVDPKGIDKNLQDMQELIYENILLKWNLAAADINLYGRAYRNQTEKGYKPEVFTNRNEYTDAFFNDNVKVTGFFGVSENIAVKSETSDADCFLIMMVNLSQIKKGIKHRADEETRTDIQQIFYDASINVTGFITGIENVFKEYNITEVKFRDQHPYHCFRINFKLIYNIYNC